MKKHFFLIITALAVSVSAFAQRFSTFSNDPSVTVTEMKEFAGTAPQDRKREAEQFLKDFTEFWNSGILDYEMQQNFIEISNSMLRKKMRLFPHFQSFLAAFRSFENSDMAQYEREWLQIVNYHINNDAATFHNKMDSYETIFKGNGLYKSSNSHWVAYGLLDKMGIDKEPYLKYSDIDLVGASRQDSIEITGASGYYYPGSNKWVGKGGKVYWFKAGLGENIFANLKDYTIDMRYPKFHAEHAMMYYPDFFEAPVEGFVDDKAALETNEEKTTYPRFTSYDKLLTIKRLYKDVDYLGGFELRGSSIMGNSHGDTLAQIVILKQDTPVVNVKAKSFMLKRDVILANDARVVVVIDEDSIYHPAATFRYSELTGELLVSRTKEGIGRSPFFDTYHKLDIYAETLSWLIDNETIEFKPVTGQSGANAAIFESQNFFSSAKMKKLQGYNEENPLFTVWKIFRSHNYEPTSINTFIASFGKSAVDVKRLLMELAGEGFIEYDINNDKIAYRKKIAQYLNNDVGKKDYDNLVFESKTHHAAINLLNNEMRITGCEYFVLSDSQIVNVYPAGERVTVKKNRNMTFSGRIIAGLFDFVTHNCEFNYDKFDVTMNVIDSMIMYVEDKRQKPNLYGEYPLVKVRNTLQDLSGMLYIDMPENKCGRVNYPDYPIFESRKGSKVYYNQRYVLNGVYHKDKFYYLVDNFIIKNLDNFVTDSIKYNGRLVSGGIFPDIEQPLKVRPDFSLGFVHKTGGNGLSAYGGAGSYKGTIDLSNRGLRGKGTIDYLTSTTESDSLVFFLDSVRGRANSHIVREQLAETEYPTASVKNASLDWKPYDEAMYVYTMKTPMSVFNEVTLTGHSRLTPSGMLGSGVVKLSSADITSKQFLFKHHELLSDAADLQIYAKESNESVFKTDNYRSRINFKTRRGEFDANGDASEILFVKNEFKTTASAFQWDPIDKDFIKITWNDPYSTVDINGTPAKDLVDMQGVQINELVSTNPDKRGLRFNALTAEFNFSGNVINADGVRFINVGDAAIVPHDGKVTILEKAELQQLKNARLVAGRENKFYELKNVSAKIRSSQSFAGSGDYDFIDENKTVQNIHFDTLWFYKETQGNAKIPVESEFKFSPHFGFNGRVELHSADTFLTFVGGLELIHDCNKEKFARMKIFQKVDPINIYIEVNEKTKDVNDRKVVNAIASTNKEGRIYTCFGAAKDQFNDAEYISAFGYITFDKETQEFKAASMEKLRNPSLPGNIITLNKEQCISKGTGAIDMGTKLGRIDFTTNGTIVNYMLNDSAYMSLTTSIDFFFCDKSMKVLTDALTASYTLDFIDYSDDEDYDMALINILGEDEYYKYQKAVANGQVKKLPQKLQLQFLFASLDFTWDKENKSFVSQTHLPLIICGGKEINKMVPGRIVIEKRGSRNRLYIYFEFDDDFFFFQFENNNMYGFSSDKIFIDAIMAVDAKKRTIKSENGQPSFTYKWGNRTQKNKFVNKFYNIKKDDDEDD